MNGCGHTGLMNDEEGDLDRQTDHAVADRRGTDGTVDESADESAADQGSSTGTTPTPEFVGRIAGDDVGYAGETGAERRAAG